MSPVTRSDHRARFDEPARSSRLAGPALAASVGFTLLLGAGACDEAFDTGDPSPTTTTTATAGAGGTSPTTSGGGGVGGETGTAPTGGSSGGATTVVGGSGGEGGTGSACAHDVCEVGAALVASCDACAAAVCTDSPLCCSSDAGAWTLDCVAQVDLVCETPCNFVCELLLQSPEPDHFCSASETTCQVSDASSGLTCSTLCGANGVSCLTAWPATAGLCEHAESGVFCDDQPVDSPPYVCECAKGCGGEPPCPNSENCVFGAESGDYCLPI